MGFVVLARKSQACGFWNTPPSLEQWPEEAEGHLESIRSKAFLLGGRIGVGGSEALPAKHFLKNRRVVLARNLKKTTKEPPKANHKKIM